MLKFLYWQNAWVLLITIFAGGLIVAKLTEKPRIPDVAAYLLLGIFLGPEVLHIINVPSQDQINQWIINAGATLILFDGGMGIQMKTIKKTWFTVTLLATVGVLISAAIVGFAAHLLLHLPWSYALLLSAVIASTDPATLIPVFKRVRVFPRLQQTVEAESAFNDATAAVLVFTLIHMISSGHQLSLWQPVYQFVSEAGIGLMVGALFGFLSLILVSQKAWGIFHEYGSIVMMIIAMSSFIVSSSIHGSGFMAAFFAGLISGNGNFFKFSLSGHTKANISHFNNAITLIFRMLIFVLLGTQVDFQVVFTYIWPSLIIVFILMFIARPITVASGILPDRRVKWKLKEYLFMCWTRETGVIPAALSGMLTAERFPHADVIRAVTFLAILITILVQASTTGFIANKLQILLPVVEEDV